MFWLLILIGVIGVLWFFSSLRKTGDRAHQLLEERYARGEIDREEDLQKNKIRFQ